jgi:acetyltransferase-like isoleucine patch superfamily enzyme
MKRPIALGIIYGVLKPIVLVMKYLGLLKISKAFKSVFTQIKMEIAYKQFGSIGNNAMIQSPNRIINPKYIYIGDDFSSLYGLRMEAWDAFRGQRFSPEIRIGNNVIFNSDCHIGCIDKITIGNGVLMASRVFISDHFHGQTDGSDIDTAPAERALTSKGPVVIGDNVWIGEGAAVMPGVVIGENSIIGANAVVTKSFPADSIIAGVPAKLIRKIDTDRKNPS